VQLVHHSHVKVHFLGFTLTRARWSLRHVWRIVWLTIIWQIWKYRNDILFKNMKCDIVEVYARVQSIFWAIIRVKYKNVHFSYSDWVLKPLICMQMFRWVVMGKVNLWIWKKLNLWIWFWYRSVCEGFASHIYIFDT